MTARSTRPPVRSCTLDRSSSRRNSSRRSLPPLRTPTRPRLAPSTPTTQSSMGLLEPLSPSPRSSVILLKMEYCELLSRLSDSFSPFTWVLILTAELSLILRTAPDRAYITIGVDSSASYSINTDATATAIDSAIASSARQAATGGAVLAAESGSTSVAGSTSPRSSGTSSSSTATGTASSSSSSPSSSSTSAASFGRQLGAGLLAVAGPAVGAMALL